MQVLGQKSAADELQQAGEAFTFIHSPFCGTCHLARQMLTTIEVTYEDDIFTEFNASLHPDLMEKYKIESVPCLLITRQGQVVEKVYAFHSVPFMYEKINEFVKN